ncbi:MAG: transporter substrate-binding domain-containing protein [Rhodospirillales bacterium]|nr:transporter substrate-binding domain-containing protein [Rhodospirillales bacterium]
MMSKGALFGVLLFLFGTLHAARAEQVTMKSGIFTIPPWGLKSDDGTLGGITVDMLDAIGRHAGILFAHSYLPFKRMIRSMETGDVEISAFYRDPEMDANLVTPTVFIHDDNVIVIGLKGTDIRAYEDLTGKSIALPRGAHYLPKFDADTSIAKVYTHGHDQSVNLLLRKRVAAVAGSGRAIAVNLKDQGVAPSEMGEAYFLARHEVWVHVSGKHIDERLKARIISSVNQLKLEGVFEAILGKYYKPD